MPYDLSVRNPWTGGNPDQLSGRWKQATEQLPLDLIKSYNQITKEGIYGESGLRRLRNAIRAANMLQAGTLSRGLRGTVGRRLGSRSGAVDTMVANKVYAPLFAQGQQSMLGYEGENLASRSNVGLTGLSNISALLLQGAQNEWWKGPPVTYKQNGGGPLGWIPGLASIASDVF